MNISFRKSALQITLYCQSIIITVLTKSSAMIFFFPSLPQT